MKMFVISHVALKPTAVGRDVQHGIYTQRHSTREEALAEAKKWHEEEKAPIADGWYSHSILVSGEIEDMKPID